MEVEYASRTSEREHMSTKSSIKWKAQTADGVGYHLYDDVMDQFNDGEQPVYLSLDGVGCELVTQTIGVSVVVTIPRAIARELGLLPPLAAEGGNK